MSGFRSCPSSLFTPDAVRIGHTQKEEVFNLKIGYAFDVIAERTHVLTVILPLRGTRTSNSYRVVRDRRPDRRRRPRLRSRRGSTRVCEATP
jgi:hypothetical protein